MYKYLKRSIDLILAFLLIVLLSPLILFICIMSKLFIGKNIIFKQKRIGMNEQVFEIIKFKTMNDNCDENGNLLPDKYRITKYGKILRKLSLDEIPQLINIIKGDMSFIGPRPLLERYLPFYTDTERRRHSVRPGITGLAQINGRNNLKWDDRLNLDVVYVDSICLKNDIRIFLLTILKVIKKEDIVVDTSEVMLDLDKERLLAFED